MPADISIIIPLYNKEKFILDTLRSVYLQDISNWECIIVDDGSTDMGLELVYEFISTHPAKWKVLPIKNGGQTKARNLGIKAAVGRYLAFLDADDLWVPDKLSKQFKFLEANPAVSGVLSGYAIFQSNSKLIRVVNGKNFERLLRRWSNMRGFGGGLESVGMVRHNLNSDKFFFDETLSTSSGLDFTLNCARNGEMRLLNNIGMLYRLSEGQWHTNSDELKRNSTLISKKHSSYLKENLNESHQHYYYWIEVRKHGYPYLAHAILKDLFRFRLARLQMLYWLLSRNIKALFLGLYHRKFVREQLLFLKW